MLQALSLKVGQVGHRNKPRSRGHLIKTLDAYNDNEEEYLSEEKVVVDNRVLEFTYFDSDEGNYYVPKEKKFTKARFNCHVNTRVVELLKSTLSEVQLNMFRNTIFGYFLDMPPFIVQNQLICYLMKREIVQNCSDKFCVNVHGSISREKIERTFFYEESNRLKLTYFPDIQKVDKNQLEECFIGKRWKSDEDVVKSVVLYFIYTFLLSAVANRVYVSDHYFYLVESGEVMTFSWGKIKSSKPKKIKANNHSCTMMKKHCDDKELRRKDEKLGKELSSLKKFVEDSFSSIDNDKASSTCPKNYNHHHENFTIHSESETNCPPEFFFKSDFDKSRISIIQEYVHIKGVDGDEDGNAGIDLSYSKGKMKNELCSVEKVACENVIDSSDALEGRVHNEMISENNSNQDIKFGYIMMEVVISAIEPYAVLIPHLFSVTGIYMNKKGVDFQQPPYSNAAILKSLEVRFVGEYFIRKKQISSDFDENQYRSRLACLLWDYGLTKKNQQAESDSKKISKKMIIQKRQKL
ncbi:hypothetical protein H5410_061913 [Solanum commersonii]|uniref:DUF1985 domain-containing protein n=1 Tax=Solanum commersonii TaxID=4109 RepID=A0A9J5W907_SOLCO|nr:hypothetical protein H5410_061913 [Solanum commersonii]